MLHLCPRTFLPPQPFQLLTFYFQKTTIKSQQYQSHYKLNQNSANGSDTTTTTATESVADRLSKKYGKSPQLATPRRGIRTPASSPLASTTSLLDKTVSTRFVTTKKHDSLFYT